MSPTVVPRNFNAVRTDIVDGKTSSRIERISLDELTHGEVVVRTLLAGVNYKDCLSLHGQAKIIVGFPRIAGIELVGEVVSSDAAEFKPGEHVLLHGFQTGIAFDGAFAEYVRVPAAHLLHIPANLSYEEAGILGVPAVTAAMAVERFESTGIDKSQGTVAVTGATGAVGLMAISLLRRAHYRVAAITRRAALADTLRALGAEEVIDSSTLIDEPLKELSKGRFAAAVDNVGGHTLSWLLSSMQRNACVASIGNASGNRFEGNVLPFILRAVELVGIIANPPLDERRRIWARLANEWKPDFAKLRPHVRFIRLEQLIETSVRQLDGANQGRILIDFR
jgi:putative YhdH/YhfP family quinone oxidoreductase